MSGWGRVGGWLAPVATGFALGAGWGVLARVWMRQVTNAPSFSWSGTLFIIGLSAFAGGLLGIVAAARRRQGRVWWRLAAVPGLLLFAGPGMVLLPAALVGGWAWAGRGPVVLRALAGLALLAAPVAAWLSMSNLDRLGINPIAAVGGFWVLEATLAAAGAVWFRRWPARAPQEVPAAAVLA